MGASTSGTYGAVAQFAPGDVIDNRYEIRSDLGRGAGGVVFEARHQFTGRTVALKLVSPGAERANLTENRARLVREARALAAAHHPGIVEVLDGGVLPDGTPYFVMEKLEGRTLEGLLAARRKISIEDAVALGLQICDALGVAHKSGVVHRDLKPSNIFVVRERDGVERVKIVDFGTAQLAQPETQTEKLTGSGAILGTPAYMAPEQLLADPDIDRLADIYALGITLIECVTGRVPYEGNYQKVLLQVCSTDAPQPLKQIFPDLDPALVPVLQRAIAKKRADRFPNAIDLARALHAAVPAERRRTTLLGAPPVPKFAPATPPAADPRRKVPRAPYVTPVSLAVGGGTVDGRSEDISEGGLLVITRQACEANQRAKVRFASPIEGRVVTCDAHVRWVRAAPPEVANGARAIGLEFIEPTPEVRASIARYVAAMGEATGS
jgi:serine/threonine-protein kinase